mmetsp:Transcript_26610/g.66197  ORF Transcript_26610/g.66197 Transcript_26610/m.66197 type:complete len:103 (-) Transcript_26610:22-330(-)
MMSSRPHRGEKSRSPPQLDTHTHTQRQDSLPTDAPHTRVSMQVNHTECKLQLIARQLVSSYICLEEIEPRTHTHTHTQGTTNTCLSPSPLLPAHIAINRRIN